MRKSSPVRLCADNYNDINLCLFNSRPYNNSSQVIDLLKHFFTPVFCGCEGRERNQLAVDTLFPYNPEMRQAVFVACWKTIFVLHCQLWMNADDCAQEKILE